MSPIFPKTHHTNSLIWFFKIVIVFVCVPCVTQAQSLLQAKQAFQQGHYQQAIELWQSALATTQNTYHRLETYKGIAAAYRHLELHDKALLMLNTALPLVHQIDDITYHTILLNELTQLYLSQGESEKAQQTAEKALSLARKTNNPIVLAKVLRQWGNLLSIKNDYKEALVAYTEAATLVNSNSSEEINELFGKILIDQAQTTFLFDLSNSYQYTEPKKAFRASINILEQALDLRYNWLDAYSEAFALITISQLAQEIQKQIDAPVTQLTHLTYQALKKAQTVAERIDNALAKTYAYGYMGQLYEQAKRYQEAIVLTRKALFWAQPLRNQLPLYHWWWQLGRILKAQGAQNEAIEAYRPAVKNLNLNSTREQLLSVGYKPTAFRDQIAPVYFELADLLLQQAAATPLATQREKLLREARQTIEFFKTAELQDYFQNECVALQSQCIPLEQALGAQTAVLYPIILPDRLELLLSLPNVEGLVQITVPVSEKTLRQEIMRFLSPLRRHPLSYGRSGNRQEKKKDKSKEKEEEVTCTPSSWQNTSIKINISKRAQRFLRPAQQLYTWFIQPITEQLSTHNINTLVLVPEGKLRTIPFAALHDGQKFLIQNYALAITPSLCLNTLKPQPRDISNMLVSGLSEAVQGFSSLPCAKYEIETLQKVYNLWEPEHIPLFNHTFTYPQLQEKTYHQRYSIVHIASHGQFKSDLQNTFLLTYNEKLSMDRLEQLIRRTTLQDKPVDLLTLSACETARGNDRAALGLAGVALKAGAKSALASLWKVDDVTTPMVIIEFYRQLTNPMLSKAQALQNAQKMMLTDTKYTQFQHPYYWSAFLLIGNWL